MATAPPAVGPPALMVAPLGPPSWRELYDTTDWVFTAPVIPYTFLSAAFFRSVDPPETLLMKLERTSLESPVMVMLVLDEAPDSMHMASAGAGACLGLQASTTQLLPLELRGARDGWAQEHAEKIFGPLHATLLPLSSATFQTRMEQLCANLVAQHAM